MYLSTICLQYSSLTLRRRCYSTVRIVLTSRNTHNNTQQRERTFAFFTCCYLSLPNRPIAAFRGMIKNPLLEERQKIWLELFVCLLVVSGFVCWMMRKLESVTSTKTECFTPLRFFLLLRFSFFFPPSRRPCVSCWSFFVLSCGGVCVVAPSREPASSVVVRVVYVRSVAPSSGAIVAFKQAGRQNASSVSLAAWRMKKASSQENSLRNSWHFLRLCSTYSNIYGFILAQDRDISM